jgi:hypothetical protein
MKPTARCGRLLGLALICALGACSRSGLFAPAAPHVCVPLEPGRTSSMQVSAEVVLHRTDILFLVDNSSSMADEIRTVRDRLSAVIAPQIRASVSDSDLGVAVFSDFGEQYLGQPSHPYRLLQPITPDVEQVVEATKRIKLEYGGDDPESQLEALYQAATGKGYGIYIKSKTDCPEGTHGGVCFRDGSFAVVMLFTDAPMRNVPGLLADGSSSPAVAYDSSAPGAPYIPYVRGYDETIAALRADNVHVIGLWSGGSGPGEEDLRRVAHDTGALDEAGEPIVFDIGDKGEALGEGVVQSLNTLGSALRVGVRVVLADGDPSDDLDPRSLLTSVRALRAEPASGAMLDGERFTGVRPGTRVVFQLSFDASALPTKNVERRFPLALRIETDDSRPLLEQTLDLVVGGTTPCPAPGAI